MIGAFLLDFVRDGAIGSGLHHRLHVDVRQQRGCRAGADWPSFGRPFYA